MTNLEMVEKLMEKADVSYAEAKAVLEETDWDMLDAMVLLERRGRVKGQAGSASYSTASTAVTEAHEGEKSGKDTGTDWDDLLGRFGRWVAKIIRIGNTNDFVVERRGQHILGLPVTAFAILTLFCFWVIVPLLLVGLFFGYQYSFAGPQLGREDVNSAMNRASQVAEDIKGEFHKK